MLQIRELREEALNQYIRCLTADNICSELQSPFASRHETIANLAFGFLRQNWVRRLLPRPSTTALTMLADRN